MLKSVICFETKEKVRVIGGGDSLDMSLFAIAICKIAAEKISIEYAAHVGYDTYIERLLITIVNSINIDDFIIKNDERGGVQLYECLLKIRNI